MTTLHVTVIIPTFNESRNIGPIMHAVRSVVPPAKIVVVDDSSPDGTAACARDVARLIGNTEVIVRKRREGLGHAYIHAFRHIRERYPDGAVLMMDADFSHDPRYISDMLERRSRCNVIIGSRYIGNGSGTVGWEVWRRLLSRLGNFYCRMVTGLPIADCTAGFMLVPTKYLSESLLSQLNSSGYAFLMELKYFLWKSGAQFCEVPIVFANRREGESKISNHIIGEGLLAPWRLIFKRK